MADKTLDVKALNCPLPILRAEKSLKEVPAGGTLEILATDPGSVADFEAFCRATGNQRIEVDGERRRPPLPDQAHGLRGGRGAALALSPNPLPQTPRAQAESAFARGLLGAETS